MPGYHSAVNPPLAEGRQEGPAALEVRHVSRSFTLGRERLEVLHDISFQIVRGDLVAIVG